MADIIIKNEPGKHPEITLAPGNVLEVRLPDTDARIIFSVPPRRLDFPQVDIYSPENGINENIFFVPTILLERITKLKEGAE